MYESECGITPIPRQHEGYIMHPRIHNEYVMRDMEMCEVAHGMR